MMTDRQATPQSGRAPLPKRCASPASASAATRTLEVRNPYTRRGRRHRAEGRRRRHPPRLRRRTRVQAEADALRALPRSAARPPSSSASRTDAISDLITAECGICKKDSLYEVGRACDVFMFAGNAALQDDGQVFSCDLTPHGKSRKVYTLREPLLGVISAITPFNHPLNQVAHKIAPVDRDQQPDGAEAHREDAAVSACCSPTSSTKPACRRRCSRSSPAIRARSPTRCSSTRTSTSSRSPAASPSASTSRQRRSTSGRCWSWAATTRSSSWRTPTSTRPPRSPRPARTRTPASAARRSSGCSCTKASPMRFVERLLAAYARMDATATRWIPRSTWAR